MGEGNTGCEKYASRSKIYLDVSFEIDKSNALKQLKKKNAKFWLFVQWL